MSAEDGGAYSPQHNPGASLRFELFKAAPSIDTWVDPAGGLTDFLGVSRDEYERDPLDAWLRADTKYRRMWADAGLRALGLVGEEQDGELHAENERALRHLSMAFGNPCVDGDGVDGLAGGLVEYVIAERVKSQAETATAAHKRAEQSRCKGCHLLPINCDCPPESERKPRPGEIDKAMLEQHNDALKTEAATLRTQRDALANALRETVSIVGRCECVACQDGAEVARAALAALAAIEKESTP